jgi:hypothetical protein
MGVVYWLTNCCISKERGGLWVGRKKSHSQTWLEWIKLLTFLVGNFESFWKEREDRGRK